MFKVDFEKAFDSVDWCFLVNVLIERGFPPKWTSVVLNSLQTSSSTVLVNGSVTPFFLHKRGLRQGCPLSPMIFIIVADTVTTFIKSSMGVMHPPILISLQPIQFADDTIIIAEAHATTLKVIILILKLYERLTGLKVNSAKSSFVPISIAPNLVSVVADILQCGPSTLPAKYLGLPLTTSQPRRGQYQSLILAVHNRMAGWKANLLSYGGRLTLLKSVMSSMPLHFMQVLALLKWVVKHIDRLRRSFLEREWDMQRHKLFGSLGSGLPA